MFDCPRGSVICVLHSHVLLFRSLVRRFLLLQFRTCSPILYFDCVIFIHAWQHVLYVDSWLLSLLCDAVVWTVVWFIFRFVIVLCLFFSLRFAFAHLFCDFVCLARCVIGPLCHAVPVRQLVFVCDCSSFRVCSLLGDFVFCMSCKSWSCGSSLN